MDDGEKLGPWCCLSDSRCSQLKCAKIVKSSLIPRASRHPVFDRLQYAKLKGRPGPFYHVNAVNFYRVGELGP